MLAGYSTVTYRCGYVTLGSFVAIAALMVGLLAWLHTCIIAMRAAQADQGDYLVRIEATLNDLDRRSTRLEAG